MVKYDYLKAITEDVKKYFRNDPDKLAFDEYESFDDMVGIMTDIFFLEDSVTGNGDANAYAKDELEASQYLAGNWDVLLEALKWFGISAEEALKVGPIHCDVIVRCYYVADAVDNALTELKKEVEEVKNNK